MFGILLLMLVIGIIAFIIFKINLNQRTNNNFVDKNFDNQEITREYVISRLRENNLDARLRESDTNISILVKNKAIGFIDFKKEIPEYGYPVARFTQDVSIKDERIVPFHKGSKYSIRNNTLKDEKFNIGIKNHNDLDLVINVLKNLSK